MAKFRKKPIEVEAEQFLTGEGDFFMSYPVLRDFRGRSHIIIKTLEGDMVAYPGDWIITGIAGEQYPCRKDIFEATYEPAD